MTEEISSDGDVADSGSNEFQNKKLEAHRPLLSTVISVSFVYTKETTSGIRSQNAIAFYVRTPSYVPDSESKCHMFGIDLTFVLHISTYTRGYHERVLCYL